MPPKGSRGSEATIPLMNTLPAWTSLARPRARSISRVQRLAPKPNWESLATAIASSVSLARITGGDACLCSRLHVGVSQDDEGVRASKLQNALLESAAASAADLTAGAIAPGQCYRPNAVVLNQ